MKIGFELALPLGLSEPEGRAFGSRPCADSTFTMWDDCMSFPDKMVKVRRHRSISLSYIDPATGKRVDWQRMGQAEAELLQHELDHLDGVLAVDHADTDEAIVPRAEYLARRDDYDAAVDYKITPTI